jgi:hypothetical protein
LKTSLRKPCELIKVAMMPTTNTGVNANAIDVASKRARSDLL